MPNIYIDAAVFGVPMVGVNAAAVDRYLELLLELQDLREAELAELLVSSNTPDLLAMAGCYPYWDALPVSENTQRADVQTVIDWFMRKSRTIESEVGVEVVVLDGPTCTPNAHLADRHVRLQGHHHEILAIMCSEEEFGINDFSAPVLVTTALPTSRQELAATGTIALLEPNRARPALPYAYTGTITACNCIIGVLQSLDAVSLCLDEGDVYAAILVTLAQRTGRAGFGRDEPTFRFRLGTEFVESVGRSGLLASGGRIGAFLRACVETILGENMAATHALREGGEATKPQLVRSVDSARAMRRDIDYEFHLHYWTTREGPELAIVVTHNDYRIPE